MIKFSQFIIAIILFMIFKLYINREKYIYEPFLFFYNFEGVIMY